MIGYEREIETKSPISQKLTVSTLHKKKKQVVFSMIEDRDGHQILSSMQKNSPKREYVKHSSTFYFFLILWF
jgi:hypothetical protein